MNQILANLPVAAVVLDERGRLTAANDLAAAIFGCSPAELVADRFDALLPLGEPARSASPQRLSARRANGVPVILDVAAKALEDEGRTAWLCVLSEVQQQILADEAARYFKVAFDNAPIGKAVFNCDGEYVRVNDQLCALLGRPAHALIGRRDQELTHPDDRQADLDAAWRILAGEASAHQCEKRFVRSDGSVVWVLANLTFLRDEADRPLGWVGQFQDVTARRAAEEQLRAAEQRFRLAFDHAPIGIALVSPEGRWLRVNRMICEMLDVPETELLGTTFQQVTHPDDLDVDLEHVRAMLAGEIETYEMEKRYLRGDGQTIWMLLSVSLVRHPDGRPMYFISQLQDIDERKRAQHKLERLAWTDALTGTLNRRAWDAELAQAITEAERSGHPLAIALLDLNAFKQVNDQHGHEVGDALLQRAATGWQAQLRSTDALARLGGDEFAVLLPNCGPSHVDELVARLRHALPHTPGCGIGVAVHRPGEDPAALLRRADGELYLDKASTHDVRAGEAVRLMPGHAP